MKLSNTPQQYGLVSVALHWLMALLIFGLFGLGLYMTSLGYYDPWYRTGPDLHRSLGLLVAALWLLRLSWRRLTPRPVPLSSHQPWEQRLAEWAHRGLYALMLLIFISGYLISTADGRAIAVFGWFEVPALISDIDGQEDVAGLVHLWLAWLLMALVGLHALGAVKHQLLDRDGTLWRMLGRNPTDADSNPSPATLPLQP